MKIWSIVLICLTLITLGKIFSREHVFLIFPRKQVLTFHAKFSSGDSLLEMSILFSGNINLLNADLAQRVVKVKKW